MVGEGKVLVDEEWGEVRCTHFFCQFRALEGLGATEAGETGSLRAAVGSGGAAPALLRASSTPRAMIYHVFVPRE